MKSRQIPGMQVAVVQHGRVVMRGAYGLADVEHGVPVTDETLFSIASISKAFTGVAVMQLVEAGKLDLGAPVSAYLTGLPKAWQKVTVRQLLTHVSGIPDIVDQKKGRMAGDGSPSSFISEANDLPMQFATGERFSYNQTNYLLLGKIIAALSGDSYERFVEAGQFDKVGMKTTQFGGFSDLVRDRAQPYGLKGDGRGEAKLVNIFYESVPMLNAANGINSSAGQIAQWIIALQGLHLLHERASLGTLWTPGLLNNGERRGFGGALNGYALGWPVVERPVHRAYAPIGGNWAAVFVYPEDDLSVVVLTNLEGSHPEAFVDELAGFFVPDIANAPGFVVPAAIRMLERILQRQGFEHAAEVIGDPANQGLKSQLREADVNAWGYRLRGKGMQGQALEIFKLNVLLYPTSANVYDSLADAYEGLGEREMAVRNYKRSLELNPQNGNAVERLKVLNPATGKGSH